MKIANFIRKISKKSLLAFFSHLLFGYLLQVAPQITAFMYSCIIVCDANKKLFRFLRWRLKQIEEISSHNSHTTLNDTFSLLKSKIWKIKCKISDTGGGGREAPNAYRKSWKLWFFKRCHTLRTLQPRGNTQKVKPPGNNGTFGSEKSLMLLRFTPSLPPTISLILGDTLMSPHYEYHWKPYLCCGMMRTINPRKKRVE